MIAIIPARGGSKGLPRKNIRDLLGKPLIAYTIDAALSAKCIHRVVVTTDDREIAGIARLQGAEVPFLRPENLAQDTSRAVDVYNHALLELEHCGERIEEFCVLLPTSPLRTAWHIDEAFGLFRDNNADSVLSVTAYDHPIFWALEKAEDRRIRQMFPEANNKNRQELPEIVRPNGAIYIFTRSFFSRGIGYFGERSFGYEMRQEDSIDIDTEMDLRLAEFILKKSVEQ